MAAPSVNQLSYLEKTYKIESDQHHLFNLTIKNLKSSIEFFLAYHDNVSTQQYKKKYFLDEIKKNNKYFTILETIDQVFDDLVGLINKNTTKICESKDNIIYIIIPLESQTLKEIIFQIKKIEKNDKEKIEELYSLVLEIKNENISLKKENQILKEKVKKLESYIPYLEEFKKKNKQINSKENIKKINFPIKKSPSYIDENTILANIEKLKLQFPKIKDDILMNALEAADGNYEEAINFVSTMLEEN